MGKSLSLLLSANSTLCALRMARNELGAHAIQTCAEALKQNTGLIVYVHVMGWDVMGGDGRGEEMMMQPLLLGQKL